MLLIFTWHHLTCLSPHYGIIVLISSLLVSHANHWIMDPCLSGLEIYWKYLKWVDACLWGFICDCFARGRAKDRFGGIWSNQNWYDFGPHILLLLLDSWALFCDLMVLIKYFQVFIEFRGMGVIWRKWGQNRKIWGEDWIFCKFGRKQGCCL